MPARSATQLFASAMQTSMLMPVFRGEKSQPYVQQFRWTFKEAIVWEEYKALWRKVLKRHDVFYFNFELTKDGTVRVTKNRRLQVRFSHEDWGRLSTKRKRAQLNAFLKSDTENGFESAGKPLCRFHCIRMSAKHYELVITSHHAILDGRSRRILIQEFLAVQHAKSQNKRVHLAPAPKFEAYLRWRSQQTWRPAKAFWKRRLQTIEEATSLEMGYDSVSKTASSGYSACSTALFSPAQSDRIRKWSERTDFSLNILAQAAWGLLLSSYSGKEEVVFAAPRACRRSSVEDSENMVGILMNTVPVVLRPGGDRTVLDYLQSVRENWTDTRKHEHTPYHVFKNASGTAAKDPLFKSYLSFENYQLSDLIPSETQKKNRVSLQWFNEVPISLNIQNGNALRIELSYDRTHFSRKSIRQLVEVYRRLFVQLTKQPDRALRNVQLLPKKDQARILNLGTGRKPLLKHYLIHEAFEWAAKQFPSDTALRFEGESTSYRQLNHRANQLARLLIKEGLKPGGTVGLYFERNTEAILAQIAVLKAGGIFVPLNTTHPKKRISWMLSNSNPRILLTQVSLEKKLGPSKRRILCIDNLNARINRYAKGNLKLKLQDDATAYVMYTSGSTGRPKGVVVPHAGIVRLVQNVRYARLNRNTRSLQLTALTFDLSTFEIWGALLNGGTCVLYPGAEPEFSVLEKIIRSESINTVLLSASVFNSIVDNEPRILAGVDQLVIGAEALSPPHVARCLKRLPELRLINGYGPTEASALNNCYSIPRSQSAKQSVPIGPPIPHSTACILDRDQRLLPPGVPGELHLGGIGLASGYLGNARQTRERFIPNPLGRSQDPTLYRTGDRCFMHADGNFDYLERFDDQLKIRGHRIEPGEIRTQILRIKDCRDCRVMAVTNDRGEEELRAFTVLEEGSKLAETQIKESLRTSLPSYMIPAHIVFLESLPLNSNGKVDRRQLAELKIARSPQKDGKKEKPSPTETVISAMWKDLLGIAPTHLDLDFFEAGGHSLLATSLIFRIQRHFHSGIPFTVFDTHSTVRGLASWIDQEKRSRRKESGIEPLILKPMAFEDTTPLGLKWRTFCIPDIKDPDGVHSLLITRAVLLEGILKPKLLSQAMEQVINANQRLRTKGHLSKGKCFERVEGSIPFDLPYKDLTHMTEEKALKIAHGIFRKESLANMNMRYAPQIRVQLLRIAKRKYFLSFVIQHAVADGYAVEMFYKQTSKAYNRLLAKDKKVLSASRFSYREFEAQLETWLKRGNARRIRSFWRKELKQIRSIPYPFLVKDVPADISWNQLDHHWFNNDWSKKIKAFCRDHKISTFVFFATIVKLLIARYTGVRDSYFTSAVNGRTGSQQEDIFGDFACTILVRTKLGTRKSFIELAEAEAAKLYTCLDHKYISVNGLDAPHKKQVAHPHSPFGQLQVIEGADTGTSLQLKGVKSKFLMRTRSGALARLGFVVRETRDSLQITFAYAPMIFVPHSIDRLKFNFQSLLQTVLQNPEITINQLPDLSAPSMYQKPLSEWEYKRFILTDTHP